MFTIVYVLFSTVVFVLWFVVIAAVTCEFTHVRANSRVFKKDGVPWKFEHVDLRIICRALTTAGFNCVDTCLVLVEKGRIQNSCDSNALLTEIVNTMETIQLNSTTSNENDIHTYDPNSVYELDSQQGPPKPVLLVCISKLTTVLMEVKNIEHLGDPEKRPQVVLCCISDKH
jgi:hypothetical protein